MKPSPVKTPGQGGCFGLPSPLRVVVAASGCRRRFGLSSPLRVVVEELKLPRLSVARNRVRAA